MVYKPPPRLTKPNKGPCERHSTAKRLINMGASIEQRPWKPTARKAPISNEPIAGKPSYKIIPPYLGPHVIDSKKKSAPAYSLGSRLTQGRSHADFGPAKYNVRGLCSKGLQRAPAFTLKFRLPEVKNFQTPSASKYSIGNGVKATTKTIPKFSFGKKPFTIKSLPTPAANVYNLPAVFGTAKEGRIKAAPAFSMLGRAKPRKIPTQISPGPGDYENNYRYLQKIPPCYSLHIKPKVINDEYAKPGPGAHCPEKFIKHKSVPAPSFAIQHTPFLGQRKAYLMQERKPAHNSEWIF